MPAGQTVALVGTTGAGKTTIAKLIARFYDPTVGLGDARRRRPARHRAERAAPARRDGHPGELHVRGHRRRQHPLRPARTPPTHEVRAAAAAVGADRFIDALAEGYDTDVAKRGGAAVGGAAAAGRVRPGVPRRPGRADPRRGDLVAGHPERADWCSGRCARCWPTAPRWSSRTGCPPSRSPTGYWCSTAGSSSRTAPRGPDSPRTAGTPRCTGRGWNLWRNRWPDVDSIDHDDQHRPVSRGARSPRGGDR